MEHQHYVNELTPLLDARNTLRSHLAIETCLLEAVDALPEDDFLHFARESLQLGAGLALLDASEQFEDTIPDIDHLVHAFCETRPKARHTSDEELYLTRQLLRDALKASLSGGAYLPLHPFVNEYEVEAAIAFIDGYQIVHTAIQDTWDAQDPSQRALG